MIKLNFTNKTNCKFTKTAANKMVEESISLLGINEDLVVEIILTDKIEIASLNKKFRKVEGVTDVLSFPQAKITSSRINIFGSIVICPEIAFERGESIAELIKHGILHLAGYDHETNSSSWNKAATIIKHKM